jgi:hypothetical protein
MVVVTSLPLVVTILVRGMPGIWKSRQRLILCGLVFMHALDPGRKTLEALSRWPPAAITAWRFRRLLQASDGHGPLRLEWWGQAALHTLPPPQDGPLCLVGDGSEQPPRGTPHPLAHTGRTRAHPPWCFGLRFALVSVTWAVSRFPGAFRLLRPKRHPASQAEHALLRELVGRFVPPSWAKRVLVEGAAAYGSQDQRKRVLQRDADAPARRWGLVCASARPWKTVAAKASKDWVTHGPRTYSHRARGPRLPGPTGGKPFWVSSTRLCLRHLGDVTGVRRKRGRHLGPTPPKILVTNLDEWPPRQVVGADQRRWPVEHIKRALKTAWGRGAHQGSGEEGRLEKSFGIAVLASLLRLRACHQESVPGTSWRMAQLQHTFRLRVMTNQVEHHLKARLTKARNVA